MYQNTGRVDEAKECLKRLITGGEGLHYRSVDVGLRTYRGMHELALLHRKTGELDTCERILADVVRIYPDYLPARQELAAMRALLPGPEGEGGDAAA